jgi:hypothetical protein
MKWAALLKLNKIVPLKSSKLTAPFQDRMIGIVTPEEKELVYSLRKNADLPFIKWAVNEILNWKNDQAPAPLYHLHGSADRIFPLKKVKADVVVPNGGHLMIMNRANEVSKYVQEVLSAN